MLVMNTDQSHFCKGADGRHEGWLSKSTGLFGSSLRMPTKSSTICILQGLHPCNFLVPSYMNSGEVCPEVTTVQSPESSTFTGDVKPENKW